MFDLRDVLKSLRRDAGYSATVVLTLALTVGATTAVFSIVNGVLLKPLAYRESHQLVTVREVYAQIAQQYPTLPVNAHHFDLWRTTARTFDALGEFLVTTANLTGGGEPRQITIARTTGGLFDALGVAPALGRTLTNGDEQKSAADVVVVTDALWRDRLGAQPDTLGRPLTIDGKPYTIVGILPASFRLPQAATVMSIAMDLTAKTDALVPLKLDLDDMSWLGDFNYTVVGRLKAGVSADQGRAELNVIQARASAIATEREHEAASLGAWVMPLDEAVAGTSRRGLWLLLAAIGVVLLIACSNLANLSLTRTVGRLRDAAIRVALGASQGRLLARVVLEQLVLAAVGGALGLGVANAALGAFVRTAPTGLPRVDEVTLDLRVLAFSAATAVVTGLLIALLPAWRLTRRDVQMALRGGAWGTSSDRSGSRARETLIAVQVALSMTLLVVTALLGASFFRLLHVDRGFASDRVITAMIAFPASRYDKPAPRIDAYDRVLAGLHALPGVEAATWMSVLPTRGEGWIDILSAAGDSRPVFERPTANYRFVAPEFFKVASMPILKGRTFSDAERDANRPMPALVSARTASVVWKGRDAIGQRFTRGDGSGNGFEVVGIVADARLTALDKTPPLLVYVPYWVRSSPRASLMVRTAAAPSAFVGELRRVIGAVDPDAAIAEVQTLDEVVDASVAARRYQMNLFVVFGLVALAIAIIGVYGVTAYGVSRRRREMNIRVALGADVAGVVRLIVRQGLTPVGIGIGAGVVGAVTVGGVVASLLFDVRPRDPMVIAGVALIVAASAVLACFAAARQGLVINPAAALREE